MIFLGCVLGSCTIWSLTKGHGGKACDLCILKRKTEQKMVRRTEDEIEQHMLLLRQKAFTCLIYSVLFFKAKGKMSEEYFPS